MDLSFFLSISLFAFTMSGTPGPNNVMLLASGVQYGYWRTMPHILGVLLGIMIMNLSVLMGLGALFKLYPSLYDALKVIGCAYLLWLAWRIATATTVITSDKATERNQAEINQVEINQAQRDRIETQYNTQLGKPMSLLAAALFQFVNPKAWTMSIGSMSTFTVAGHAYIESGIWIILAFLSLGFIAISLWTWLGVAINQWLTTTKRKRRFNQFMGALTASTLVLIVM